MKTTTTLFYILRNELINRGHDEFVDKHQLVFYSDEHVFIKKIMKYDEDVEEIANTIFFGNVFLNTEESDRKFKREFLNKFLYRQIGFQTVELFSSSVIYLLLSKLDYLNYIYDDLDDFIKGKSTTESDDTNKDTSDNRFLSTTLPQDEVNLNVDNTILNYGDTNTISRTKNDKTGQSNTTSKNFNMDALLKSKDLINVIFDEFDLKCFLQIW